MQGLFRPDDQFVYRFLPWMELDWLEHGFGTRQSEGWSRRPELISLNQIHSDVSVYSDGAMAGRIGDGDALFTDVPGALVAVRTADCVPILIADVSKRTVAAVHAGWRGTSQAIVAKTVGAVAARLGSHAQDLQAVIGPSIGPCCYEVGAEVALQFKDVFPEVAALDQRSHLDLPEANRRQLLSAGVSPEPYPSIRVVYGLHGGGVFLLEAGPAEARTNGLRDWNQATNAKKARAVARALWTLVDIPA